MSEQIEVGLDDLAEAMEDGAVVIDVRNPDEYVEVHIPGVRLIPMAELGQRLDEIPRDERVYVVCAVGGRSFNAAKALNQAGFDTVSVAGGTKAWAAEGRPVESGPGPHA